MGKSEKPRPGKPSKGEPPVDDAERAFDVWLRRGLHQMYDTVTKEPVPDELLRLIEDHRTAGKK